MLTCSFCGTKNPDGTLFCEMCGHRFVEQSSISKAAPAFLMPIEDVFQLTGRGLFVVGRIVAGNCSVGDAVDLILDNGSKLRSSITYIEKYRETVSSAQQGENVGIGLSDVKKEQIKQGDVVLVQALSAAGSVVLHTAFIAQLHLHETHNKPIFNHYYPGFSFSSSESWIGSRGILTFMDDITEILMPGATAEVKVTLDKPCTIIEGMSFGVHEGGSSFVASGKITTIID